MNEKQTDTRRVYPSKEEYINSAFDEQVFVAKYFFFYFFIIIFFKLDHEAVKMLISWKKNTLIGAN